MAGSNTRSPKAQRSKRLTRYFTSAYSVLVDTLYEAVPTLTVFDENRLTKMLSERAVDEYTGSEAKRVGPVEFEGWAVGRIRELAQITASVKASGPGLIDALQSDPETVSIYYNPAQDRVLSKVWQYSGEPSDRNNIEQWTVAMLLREAQNIELWSDWIVKYRNAALAGIWKVLRDCADLGLGEPEIRYDRHGNVKEMRNHIVEEVLAEFQDWLLDNIEKYVPQAGVSPGAWIKEVAYWQAREWKTNRIRKRDSDSLIRGLVREYERAEVGDVRPKWRPVVLEPGDTAPYEPAESKMKLDSWDIPVDNLEFTDPKKEFAEAA